MATTDELIASLAKEAAPAVKPVTPSRLLIQWLGVCAFYAVIIVALYGLRADMPQMLASPEFILEMFLLAALIVTTGLASAALSFPDRFQRQWMTVLPAVPFFAFAILLYVSWVAAASVPQEVAHGIECLLCITLYSLLPAGYMLHMLRRQASTHYYLLGGSMMLAAGSFGCLLLRLIEPANSMLHLITWHYLPLVAFSMIGLWIGRKVFKW
jgi:hypothetical protein